METVSVSAGDFTYAFGRIGVLQQLLLKQEDVDRLLGARDRADLNAILTEMEFSSLVDQSLSTAETILPALGTWVREEVARMAPTSSQEVFSILWLQYDMPLISYLVKEHHGLTSSISTCPDDGMCRYSAEEIRAYLKDGSGKNLSPTVTTMLTKLKVSEPSSPQAVDAAVAAFVAGVQTELAEQSKSVLIQKYVRQLIDIANLQTALRTDAGDVRDTALLRGGSIPVSSLQGDRESILASLGRSELPYALAEQLSESTDPIATEGLQAQAIAKTLSAMWNEVAGIEPVFAFGAIALSQISLLRAIVIAKGNDLPPQEIKAMIPPFIPGTHYA